MRNNTKVLLVEDDPLLADLILLDLASLFPYNQIEALRPADSFATAADLLQREKPDMVLLDIELGEDRTAGIRLAQHINLTRPVPVVFLSGLPRREGFDIAKLTAPFGYISKPYHRQQLADVLELLLIRESQRKVALADEAGGHPSPIRSIFVTTAHGELTAIQVDKLVLLEADGKIIRAFLSDQEKAIIFSSPGLKNFFFKNQPVFGKSFFQLNRKYVINISMVRQIKDNHVVLPRFSEKTHTHNFFSIPFPANTDIKRELLALLGKGQ